MIAIDQQWLIKKHCAGGRRRSGTTAKSATGPWVQIAQPNVFCASKYAASASSEPLQIDNSLSSPFSLEIDHLA
jgi:hypothetical protein